MTIERWLSSIAVREGLVLKYLPVVFSRMAEAQIDSVDEIICVGQRLYYIYFLFMKSF
jgi:hypothetical protein